MNRLVLLCLALLLCGICNAVQSAEKRVIIYATYGVPGPEVWHIPLRIWVYEEPDFARELLAKAARDGLAEHAALADLDQREKDRFMQRAHGFIADSESGETVQFGFDDDSTSRTYRLRNADGETRTDRNGLLEGTISLPNADAEALLRTQASTDGWLTLRVVSDGHEGVGRIRLIGPGGLSVVSDIDDTAKVTNIPSGEAEVLRNTFFREFEAAPCMADLLRSFGPDAAFHYVSGGPWQLYAPLSEFLFSNETGFPEGSFQMKNVRTNPFESESYRDIWKLIANGSQAVTFEQKFGQIGGLLEQFPDRQFVLIGDSGEQDPEVFAALRDRYPGQVRDIRIRDVVDDARARPERLRGMRIIPPDVGPAFDCGQLQVAP